MIAAQPLDRELNLDRFAIRIDLPAHIVMPLSDQIFRFHPGAPPFSFDQFVLNNNDKRHLKCQQYGAQLHFTGIDDTVCRISIFDSKRKLQAPLGNFHICDLVCDVRRQRVVRVNLVDSTKTSFASDLSGMSAHSRIIQRLMDIRFPPNFPSQPARDLGQATHMELWNSLFQSRQPNQSIL